MRACARACVRTRMRVRASVRVRACVCAHVHVGVMNEEKPDRRRCSKRGLRKVIDGGSGGEREGGMWGGRESKRDEWRRTCWLMQAPKPLIPSCCSILSKAHTDVSTQCRAAEASHGQDAVGGGIQGAL